MVWGRQALPTGRPIMSKKRPRDEGQVSDLHPSLVPGYKPDDNAIGPGQSNYQIAGKNRQTLYVINGAKQHPLF